MLQPRQICKFSVYQKCFNFLQPISRVWLWLKCDLPLEWEITLVSTHVPIHKYRGSGRMKGYFIGWSRRSWFSHSSAFLADDHEWSVAERVVNSQESTRVRKSWSPTTNYEVTLIYHGYLAETVRILFTLQMCLESSTRTCIFKLRLLHCKVLISNMT